MAVFLLHNCFTVRALPNRQIRYLAETPLVPDDESQCCTARYDSGCKIEAE
jgi:hypothetical protein